MNKVITLNQYPTSRLEAHEKNISHYFTGEPCVNGHIEKRRTTDGHCLTCDCEYQKRKRKNRPEDVSRMRKAYYQKTKRHVLNLRRKNYAENESVRLKKRDRDLKKAYSIGIDDYLYLEEVQNNKCAICRGTQRNKRTKYFDVDHSHKTGKVRGLLCTNCNQGIGKFQDNKELLLRAYNYLEDSEDE
jgi:hypothetical protein